MNKELEREILIACSVLIACLASIVLIILTQIVPQIVGFTYLIEAVKHFCKGNYVVAESAAMISRAAFIGAVGFGILTYFAIKAAFTVKSLKVAIALSVLGGVLLAVTVMLI